MGLSKSINLCLSWFLANASSCILHVRVWHSEKNSKIKAGEFIFKLSKNLTKQSLNFYNSAYFGFPKLASLLVVSQFKKLLKFHFNNFPLLGM